MRKVIISVAPVAAEAVEGVENPLTPEEVAQDTIAAAEAGASMVHLHVRDRVGKLTDDLTEFSRTLDILSERSDIVIQGSTGGLSELTLEQRCVAVQDPRVEVASLNMGSANFDEGVYVNTFPDIRYWAGRMREASVLPELEIFEGGMINNVRILADEGVLSSPFLFAFALGFRGALPATADNLHFLKGLLPSGSLWGFIHHGMKDFSLLATVLGMGADLVRVGFEDSPPAGGAPGKVAQTNAELVEGLARLIGHLGLSAATPQEARQMLGLQEHRRSGG